MNDKLYFDLNEQLKKDPFNSGLLNRIAQIKSDTYDEFMREEQQSKCDKKRRGSNYTKPKKKRRR